MKLVKTILLAGVATVAVAGAAVAADPIRPVPVTPIAPVVTAYDWSGFYAGVNAGYGWTEAYGPAGVGFTSVNGLFGGAQIGFNVQHDAVVFGVEADIQASGLSQTVTGTTVSLDYLGTVRARVGVDVGNGILPYLTAGLAYGQARVDVPPVETQFHSGWAVGGGVEFKLQEAVSLKTEYLYVDLGERAYAGGNAGLRGHTFRVGANFHF